MANRSRIALLMLASALLVGCGSASPATPSPPPAQGTIELMTSRPDGSALVVTECLEEGDVFPCTRDLDVQFSVVLDRDIDRALLRAEFYNAGGRICGATSTNAGQPSRLTAGTPTTFTASVVFMGLQGSSTATDCAAPMRTTRMVARLWQSDSSGVIHELFTRDFSRGYNFVTQ